MKKIQKVELNKLAKEELLPAFSTDFPYIAICAGLAQAAASAKLSGKNSTVRHWNTASIGTIVIFSGSNNISLVRFFAIIIPSEALAMAGILP